MLLSLRGRHETVSSSAAPPQHSRGLIRLRKPSAIRGPCTSSLSLAAVLSRVSMFRGKRAAQEHGQNNYRAKNRDQMQYGRIACYFVFAEEFVQQRTHEEEVRTAPYAENYKDDQCHLAFGLLVFIGFLLIHFDFSVLQSMIGVQE